MKKEKTFNSIARIKSTLVQPKGSFASKSMNVTFATIYLLFAFLVICSFVLFYNVSSLDKSLSLVHDNKIAVSLGYFCSITLITIISIIIFKPHHLNRIQYVSFPIIIIAYVLNYVFGRFMPNDFLNILTLSIMVIGLGLFIASVIILFLYNISTYERIILIFSLLLIVIVWAFLIKSILSISTLFGTFAIPLLLLLLTYFCMFFMSANQFRKIELNNEKIPGILFALLVIIFIMFITNEFSLALVKEYLFPSLGGFNNVPFYLGIIGIALLSIVLYWLFSYTTIYYCFAWIIFVFITYSFGMAYIVFDYNSVMKIVLETLIGIQTGMGIINILMLLGKSLEDKASIWVIRFITIAFGLIFIGLFVLFNFISYSNFRLVLVISQSASFLILLFLGIYAIAAAYYLTKTDKVVTVEQKDEIKVVDNNYPNPYELLTNKELIVFEQLILGNTLRQVAGELHMKYDTVNFHYKNIYRKLGVNSRIELIMRYNSQGNTR